MKTLIQITTVFFLLVQSISYSQEQNTEILPNKQEAILKTENTKTEVDSVKFKRFIGVYFLEEADFELEIIEDNDKMYIVSPFSKDILIPKNETTLTELTRGVDLELIKDDENALKFTQNGYVTTIKRINPKTEK